LQEDEPAPMAKTQKPDKGGSKGGKSISGGKGKK
jgi:hypothetical protein